MLDADLSNSISFTEFIEGIKRTAENLDELTRVEHKVMDTLQQASKMIATNLEWFWDTCFMHDLEG